MRARGQFGVRLTDYQYFHQTLIGTLLKNNYVNFEIIRSFFRGFINQKVKKILANELITKKITYFEIPVHLDEIQEALQEEIQKELKQYGFEVSSLSIESIDCPENLAITHIVQSEDMMSLKLALKEMEMHQHLWALV